MVHFNRRFGSFLTKDDHMVIDFETLGQEVPVLADTVTVRNRDTGEQERVAIADLAEHLK
jgi:glycyl-tRNA synthetase